MPNAKEKPTSKFIDPLKRVTCYEFKGKLYKTKAEAEAVYRSSQFQDAYKHVLWANRNNPGLGFDSPSDLDYTTEELEGLEAYVMAACVMIQQAAAAGKTVPPFDPEAN